jgi:inorganic pyrophosphatase
MQLSAGADRIPCSSPRGAGSAKDLPKEWLTELQDFFVNYHNLEGKKYKLLGCKGEEVALRLIKKAQRAA